MHTFEKILFSIVLVGLLVSIGFNFHYKRSLDSISSETYIDTIPYYKPIPRDSVVIRYVTETLPVAPSADPVKPEKDTTATLPVIDSTSTTKPDSVQVVIPITQKHYKETEYEAWVSGYKPQLDSINVFAPTTVITKTEKSPWIDVTVGIQAGMGWMGQNNYAPYIGVGVTIGVPLRKIFKK